MQSSHPLTRAFRCSGAPQHQLHPGLRLEALRRRLARVAKEHGILRGGRRGCRPQRQQLARSAADGPRSRELKGPNAID